MEYSQQHWTLHRHYTYIYCISMCYVFIIYLFLFMQDAQQARANLSMTLLEERCTLNSLFTQCCDQYWAKVLNICHQTITH